MSGTALPADMVAVLSRHLLAVAEGSIPSGISAVRGVPEMQQTVPQLPRSSRNSLPCWPTRDGGSFCSPESGARPHA